VERGTGGGLGRNSEGLVLQYLVKTDWGAWRGQSISMGVGVLGGASERDWPVRTRLGYGNGRCRLIWDTRIDFILRVGKREKMGVLCQLPFEFSCLALGGS